MTDRPLSPDQATGAATIAGHAVATASTAASFLTILPTALSMIAALVGIVWYSIMIWESKTVSAMRQRSKRRH